MKNENKTKAELIKELKTLRKERGESALNDLTERKQAESKLQIERDKLTAIFESMTDGIYIINKDYDIQYVNPALKRTFGSPEGKKCHKYFHDSAEPCTFCKNEEVFAGKTVRWEWTSPKYGKTYDLIDTPMKNADGSISKLEIFRDITERKQAEESLQESEAKYRAVLEQSADNIFLADLETKKILESNVSLRNLLGYSADEMKKLTIYDFVARPKDEIKKKLEQLQKEDKTVIRERKYLRKDGLLVDVEMVRNLITFGNKKVLCVVSRDISERKKAEETLKQSEKNYRGLFNNATDAIYVQDRECRFLDVNQGAVEMYGYPKEFFIGKTPEFLSAPEKNDLNEIAGFVEDAFNGKPRQYDFWGIRKNGEIFPKIVRSQKGIYMGKEVVVTFALDITERKQLEEELLVKNLVFEESITANSISDNKGILTYVNSAFIKIFGYQNKEEAVGKPISDFLKFEDEAINIITALNETGVWEGEYTGLRKDGTIFVAYGLATIIKDKSGDSIGYQSAVLDISDRKRIEESLRESEGKYSSVVENSMDGIIVLQKGIIKFLNKAILDLTGHNLEELIDKEFESLLSPEYRKLVMDRYRARLAGKDVPSLYEMEIIRKDGISVPIEVSNTTITYGGKKATLSFIRNIAERKQAEELFKKLFISSPNAIFIIQDGKFKLVNPQFAKESGFSREELLNRDSLKTVHPEDKEMVREIIVKNLKGGLSSPFEFRGIRKDGEVVWALQVVTSITYQGKRAILGDFKDITHMKQAEEELRQSNEKLRRTMEGTINAMVKIVETRDPYTAGHQLKVSKLAISIAQEIRLSSDKIEGIKVAGLVHDIGKINIPIEILSKSTKLTDIEFSLIKYHSQIGYDILKAIDFSYPIANIVLQHHEKINGSGYPGGLKGDEILLEARIICVADVVEAMSSHRPYRPALGIDVALEEISQNKGILYDPKVVDVCLKLFKEKGFKFES